MTREFYSIKLICTNLYALFLHVKKAYTANQNGVQLFHVWKQSLPFGRGSRVEGRGSRVTSRGSRRVNGRGSRVTSRESKTSSQLFLNVLKSKFRIYSIFRFLFSFTLTPGGIMCFLACSRLSLVGTR